MEGPAEEGKSIALLTDCLSGQEHVHVIFMNGGTSGPLQETGAKGPGLHSAALENHRSV